MHYFMLIYSSKYLNSSILKKTLMVGRSIRPKMYCFLKAYTYENLLSYEIVW